MSNSISDNNSTKQSSNHNGAYPNSLFDRIALEDLAIEDVEAFDKLLFSEGDEENSQGDEENSHPTLSGSSSQVSSDNSNPTDPFDSLPEKLQEKLQQRFKPLEPAPDAPEIRSKSTIENPGLTPNGSEDNIQDKDFPPETWFTSDKVITSPPPIPDIYRPEGHDSEILSVHEGLYNKGTPNERYIISYTFADGSRIIISDRKDYGERTLQYTDPDGKIKTTIYNDTPDHASPNAGVPFYGGDFDFQPLIYVPEDGPEDGIDLSTIDFNDGDWWKAFEYYGLTSGNNVLLYQITGEGENAQLTIIMTDENGNLIPDDQIIKFDNSGNLTNTSRDLIAVLVAFSGIKQENTLEIPDSLSPNELANNIRRQLFGANTGSQQNNGGVFSQSGNLHLMAGFLEENNSNHIKSNLDGHRITKLEFEQNGDISIRKEYYDNGFVLMLKHDKETGVVVFSMMEMDSEKNGALFTETFYNVTENNVTDNTAKSATEFLSQYIFANEQIQNYPIKISNQFLETLDLDHSPAPENTSGTPSKTPPPAAPPPAEPNQDELISYDEFIDMDNDFKQEYFEHLTDDQKVNFLKQMALDGDLFTYTDAGFTINTSSEFYKFIQSLDYDSSKDSLILLYEHDQNVWDQIAVDIMVAIATSIFSYGSTHRGLALDDLRYPSSDDSVNFSTAFRSIFDNDFPLVKDGFNFQLYEQNPYTNLIDLITTKAEHYYHQDKFHPIPNTYYFIQNDLYADGKPPEYEEATYIDFYIAAKDFVYHVNKNGGLNGELITIADIQKYYESKTPKLTNEDVYMAYTLDIIEELVEKFSSTEKTEQKIYYVNSEDDIIQNNAIPGSVWIIGTENEIETVRIYYNNNFINFDLSFFPPAQELIESGAHKLMTDDAFKRKLTTILHDLSYGYHQLNFD